MRNQKIRNPLGKRILRELKGDFAKYFVIAVFMILVIGFVSGMYVANKSMLISYDKGIRTHKLEDGHFEITEKASHSLLSDIENNKEREVRIYEQFYKEAKEKLDEESVSKNANHQKSDVRIFKIRDKVNLSYMFRGRKPKNENEIAIDRMHADNAKIKIGDMLRISGKEFKVVGLISNPDYSTLFRKNTDVMFDALTFDVAIVTEEGFDRIPENTHYNYAFRYSNGKTVRPKDQVQEKKWSDKFANEMAEIVMHSGISVENYLPNYLNQAIHFAPDDMGSDKAMGGVLLYVFIAVLSFIFAITVSNTIAKESLTIGTLRASGYSRMEMLRHYMATPIIVTLFSAIVGNVLGYTVFKNTVVSMYYNSYSLPTYHTIFSMEALWKTTLVPVAIMLIVNYVILAKKLRLSPLRFLRHDLENRKRKKTICLPRTTFLSRFRMRVFLQNISGYLVIFIGVLFVMIMLAMVIGMPQTLDYYQENASDMMLAKVQTNLVTNKDANGQLIEVKDAEKIAINTLVLKNGDFSEDISVYGIRKDSEYVDVPKMGKHEAYIGHSFAEKYDIKVGDEIKLDEKYRKKSYKFKVCGIVDYEGGLAVFMDDKRFETTFKKEAGYYNAFFSEKKLEDLNDKYILNVITKKDITRMTDQLDHSMGAYMQYFQYLCVALSAVLMFLITKLIIERNANAISMTKILGYRTSEIARIYLIPTTWAVLISAILSMFISKFIAVYLWTAVFMDMPGYFKFILDGEGLIKMFVFVILGYLIVTVMDFMRIKKVPMADALKNVD